MNSVGVTFFLLLAGLSTMEVGDIEYAVNREETGVALFIFIEHAVNREKTGLALSLSSWSMQ